jgi:uncharacterized metal-binding protein YceD (DUF177 family)
MADRQRRGRTGRDAGPPPAASAKAVWRPTEITARRGVAIDVAPEAAAREALAAELGILGIPELRLTGQLSPEGSHDFRLDARMRAVVVQECVVTLAPVRTAIDEPVLRRFLADMPEPSGDEVEMPEDDSVEPLGAVIDLNLVLREALALALPPYPRAPEAATPGAAAGDADAPADDPDRQRPFAGLSALLGKGGPKD